MPRPPTPTETASSPPVKVNKVNEGPRPAFTYFALVVVVVGATWMEFATSGPEMVGVSFWVFAPVTVLGFGIDWLRLVQPGVLQVVWALVLSAAAVLIVIYGMLNDWFPTVLATAAVATGLIGLRWIVACIPPRVMEGTFIGRQDGRWLFVRGEECWALKSNESLEVKLDCRYAFLAKLTKRQGESSGCYRHASRIHGRLIELASHPETFVERRHERAWTYTLGIISAVALISVALILPQLEF